MFFQLAARLARLTNDADARAWAEKAYDWVISVGLIDVDFNVLDGTDDAKGDGCVDVNHDQWNYNVGVFMYGSAVMAAHFGDVKWVNRTRGLLPSARRTLVNVDTGVLFEARCDPDGSCNTDQTSFKGVLARWLGATAWLLPEVRADISALVGTAAAVVQRGLTSDLGLMETFTALETIDAALRAPTTMVS